MRLKTLIRRIPAPCCKNGLFPALLIVTVFLLSALTCIADEHPEQNDLLASQTGVEFQPRLGEYHYEIHWSFKRIATGIISIEKDGDHYVLTADQRTTKLIDRTYRIRYRGETRINAADLSPTESVIKEEINKRSKVQTATYDSDEGKVTVEVTKTKNKKAQPETKTYELQSDTGIMDIFSFLFLARSFDWSIGEQQAFTVFIGKKQYAVTLACIGMSAYKMDDQNIPVWVIQPTAKKLSDDDPEPKGQDSRIYIAADESKDILKATAEPGIGTVKLKMVRYLEK